MDNTRSREGLPQTIEVIRKKYGQGAILCLPSQKSVPTPTLASGIATLELAIGGDGIPHSSIIEVFGGESSGKTTLALSWIARVQRKNGIALYVDAEHSLDLRYARKLGVNLRQLWICQPEYGEQALDIAEMLICTGAIDIVVVDSVAALLPQKELYNEIGKTGVGTQARLLSQALRRQAPRIKQCGTCVVYINQLRDTISRRYGSPIATPGGRALKFYTTLRILMRKMQTFPGGIRVQSEIVKNKLAQPFGMAEFDILYEHGIDTTKALVEAAQQLGIVQKRYGKLFCARKALAETVEETVLLLHQNPTLLQKIDAEVQAKISQRQK